MGNSREYQVGGNHYSKYRTQPWDIIDEYGLDFYAGNVLKYLLRHKDKNGLEDLQKCRHYLERLIELEAKRMQDEKIRYEPVQKIVSDPWGQCVEMIKNVNAS